jgi:hypothetical protein
MVRDSKCVHEWYAKGLSLKCDAQGEDKFKSVGLLFEKAELDSQLLRSSMRFSMRIEVSMPFGWSSRVLRTILKILP